MPTLFWREGHLQRSPTKVIFGKNVSKIERLGSIGGVHRNFCSATERIGYAMGIS